MIGYFRLGFMFFTILFIGLFSFQSTQNEHFATAQKKFPRVRAAYAEKEAVVAKLLQDKNVEAQNFNLMFLAFKDEKVLELHVKRKIDKQYKLLKSYEVCASSGELGPKRVQGDGQVPEGFYHIDRFNPTSLFHLSLGINYPNASDKLMSKGKATGGDIFIHGQCVTIGCLPMTDDKIKEIYVLAVEAKNAGQNKLPVYIFPFRMNKENLAKHQHKFPQHQAFWNNLKIGYDIFTAKREALNFSVDVRGNYVFK